MNGRLPPSLKKRYTTNGYSWTQRGLVTSAPDPYILYPSFKPIYLPCPLLCLLSILPWKRWHKPHNVGMPQTTLFEIPPNNYVSAVGHSIAQLNTYKPKQRLGLSGEGGNGIRLIGCFRPSPAGFCPPDNKYVPTTHSQPWRMVPKVGDLLSTFKES